MRIERIMDRWVITRGSYPNQSFFCLFVDGDKSGWTGRHQGVAQTFSSEAQAKECLTELRRRDKLRRAERAA